MRGGGLWGVLLALSAGAGGCGEVRAPAADGAPGRDAAGGGDDAAVPLDAAGQVDAAPVRCPDGMAFVPGGTYELGGVGPEVSVVDFCIDLTPVTSSAYADCEACSAADVADANRECNGGIPARAGDPINCVDAAQAEFYCAAHGKSLPDEGQWEWAARGGEDARLYPWGDAEPTGDDDPRRLCWTVGRIDDTFPARPSGTCPVGTHQQAAVHPFGLEDVTGNVWEWTTSPGVEEGERVVRGGGWDTEDPKRNTSVYRNDVIPDAVRHAALGFRCVSEPLEP